MIFQHACFRGTKYIFDLIGCMILALFKSVSEGNAALGYPYTLMHFHISVNLHKWQFLFLK